MTHSSPSLGICTAMLPVVFSGISGISSPYITCHKSESLCHACRRGLHKKTKRRILFSSLWKFLINLWILSLGSHGNGGRQPHVWWQAWLDFQSLFIFPFVVVVVVVAVATAAVVVREMTHGWLVVPKPQFWGILLLAGLSTQRLIVKV